MKKSNNKIVNYLLIRGGGLVILNKIINNIKTIGKTNRNISLSLQSFCVIEERYIMNKKLLYSLLIVLLIVVVSVSITYAWLSWSGVVNISGTSECFDVNYVKGQDIGSDSNPANFSLASTYTESYLQ